MHDYTLASSLERRPNGALPTYTSVGAYPLLYVSRGDVLCAACASAETDDPDMIVGPYWEGPDETCGECNTDIPSAYGDPDNPED